MRHDHPGPCKTLPARTLLCEGPIVILHRRTHPGGLDKARLCLSCIPRTWPKSAQTPNKSDLKGNLSKALRYRSLHVAFLGIPGRSFHAVYGSWPVNVKWLKQLVARLRCAAVSGTVFLYTHDLNFVRLPAALMHSQIQSHA